MKLSGGFRLFIVAATLAVAAARPQQDDSLRRQPTASTPIGDSIKMLANQLMDINTTTADLTMDTRTPPKIKQQVKLNNQQKKDAIKEKPTSEFSYPGVAIPVDELSLVMLEDSTTTTTTKKPTTTQPLPTTDSGISTWILLTSQATTAKPTRKTMIKIKPDEVQNATERATEKPMKTRTTIKMRPFSTSTKRPAVTSTIMVPALTSTSRSVVVKDNKLMNKVKASVLTNAQNLANLSVANVNTSLLTTEADTTAMPFTTTFRIISTTRFNKEKENLTLADNEVLPSPSFGESSALPLEAKDGSVELSEEATTTKKPKRPNNKNKRKKNKNRNRKRPQQQAQDKMDGGNSTKLAKVPKEKPIGTQIYNYLSREVMPTVGVGLVGLMVTAGLASYFLFPFGAARRTYEAAIDRKDDSNYFYDYSGGQAEEEVIGQVIAGMPHSNGLQSQGSYRSPYSNTNSRYRPAEKKLFQSNTVQQDYYAPQRGYKSQPSAVSSSISSPASLVDGGNRYSEPVAEAFTAQRPYSGDVIAEHSKESAYTVDDKQFVVGNIPKELIQEVTPVTVPEHGPRYLRYVRKRRSTKKALDMDNEISVDDAHMKPTGKPMEALVETTTMEEGLVNITYNDTMTNSTTGPDEEDAPEKSFLRLIKDLVEMKLRLGLQLLQNTTNSFSRYLEDVQKRLQIHQDEHQEEKQSPRPLK